MPQIELEIESDRLTAAYEKARLHLLEEREPEGHWVGELSASALSTATAVSALALVERHGAMDLKSGRFQNELLESELSELIIRGIEWLADHQNSDGGWGDTDKSYSNISTTMLAVAAFHLTGVPCKHKDLLERAEAYIKQQGGVAGLKKRYGKDKTFAVPILANCAMAGFVPWTSVSALPFELACFPQKFYRFVRMPVVSYAVPALVAIGQARFFHAPPVNPAFRLVRKFCVERSLDVLQKMQPASGGYLEAVPLTSFVVMSLASTGRADHPVARQGFDFILSSLREDGSWPIDTNLATWNTTLAINALAGAGEDVSEVASLDWLLSCQHREPHPFTGADPGGWGWSDLSGAVPDADDTPSALLAIAEWSRSPSCSEEDRDRINEAADAGIQWLLGLQNSDGGWPTFCRGWGKLPFDRSGTDLTAHVLRALHAWKKGRAESPSYVAAMTAGRSYIERAQRPDGSWLPLWFGNQDIKGEENPIYGTAKVLMAYRDLGLTESNVARRGFDWLMMSQNRDGGWGGGPSIEAREGKGRTSSVEETALAVEALLAAPGEVCQQSVTKGLAWLVDAVENDRHLESSPIGFYFAKLWYHEKLYPLTFTVSALGRALNCDPARRKQTAAARQTCHTN
ncbi:MAG: squalene--hopene cyclase [Planctomycetaceae bacterium]|nr:squalene--hopene cyclase [Planctomycetales bacterium]MCB9938814.1 squalene--hopene cyclase [Planctomycetaceae bacterium]